MQKFTFLPRFAFCLAFCLLFTFPVESDAQVIFSHAFRQKLATAGLEILEPSENAFHTLMPKKNEFLPYDLVIRSEARDLEVRFALRLPAPDAEALPPHAQLMATLVSIGSNEEAETEVNFSQLPQRIVRDVYHADWGAHLFFTPKREFADWENCEVLALHAHDRGLLLALFFYDDEPPESIRILLDAEHPAIFFRKDP